MFVSFPKTRLLLSCLIAATLAPAALAQNPLPPAPKPPMPKTPTPTTCACPEPGPRAAARTGSRQAKRSRRARHASETRPQAV